MVKVIGESPEVFKQVSCSRCAAKLQYTPYDVHSISGRDISGGPEGREWIVCPNCNSEVTLKAW